jgi:hypothetical protein
MTERPSAGSRRAPYSSERHLSGRTRNGNRRIGMHPHGLTSDCGMDLANWIERTCSPLNCCLWIVVEQRPRPRGDTPTTTGERRLRSSASGLAGVT